MRSFPIAADIADQTNTEPRGDIEIVLVQSGQTFGAIHQTVPNLLTVACTVTAKIT